MSFTDHGHHIPGSPDFGTQPEQVARCGGPGVCNECSIAAVRWLRQDKEKKMADNLGKNQTSYSSPEEGIDFPTLAKRLVKTAIDENENQASWESPLSDEQVYLVWFCFILGSWKGLVSTALPNGRYYEITFNKAKGEFYIDVYQKVHQYSGRLDGS